jgi:hypothetical protein
MDSNNMIITMVITMIIAGLLSTMNVYAYNINDVRFTLNDIYMISLMIGWSLLLFTLVYYPYINNSMIIIIISILMISIAFFFIRTQAFIDDRQFLNAMISHHSIALSMSTKINKKTNNPRIKKLSEEIIKLQQKEINIMNDILKEMENKINN